MLAMTTFGNQDGFARGVVDSTLDTLRDQEDAAQNQVTHGNVQFSAQSFATGSTATDPMIYYTSGKRNIVLGPIKFERNYETPPDPGFAQILQGSSGSGVSTLPTNYIPFLVYPYVHSWSWSGGQVDGFYLGLYALTVPSPSAEVHSLGWICIGKGSRYIDQGLQESWDEPYNDNEADYLYDDVTMSEEPEEEMFEDEV